MFRNKYVYTCPDVIHIEKMRKRRVKNAIIGNLLGLGIVMVWGAVMSKRLDDEIAKNPVTELGDETDHS